MLQIAGVCVGCGVCVCVCVATLTQFISTAFILTPLDYVDLNATIGGSIVDDAVATSTIAAVYFTHATAIDDLPSALIRSARSRYYRMLFQLSSSWSIQVDCDVLSSTQSQLAMMCSRPVTTDCSRPISIWWRLTSSAFVIIPMWNSKSIKLVRVNIFIRLGFIRLCLFRQVAVIWLTDVVN